MINFKNWENKNVRKDKICIFYCKMQEMLVEHKNMSLYMYM